MTRFQWARVNILSRAQGELTHLSSGPILPTLPPLGFQIWQANIGTRCFLGTPTASLKGPRRERSALWRVRKPGRRADDRTWPSTSRGSLLILTTDVARRCAGFLLAQDPDDLLFREPAPGAPTFTGSIWNQAAAISHPRVRAGGPPRLMQGQLRGPHALGFVAEAAKM